MYITNDIKYVGVHDGVTDLFEAQYKVPNGISYNSYVIDDEKIAVMDSVDIRFADQWIANIKDTIGEKSPDFLVVLHMEPDHSASIYRFANEFSSAKIVSSKKSFDMMKNFFGTDFADRQIVVGEGDTLPLGNHTLSFLTAPMVHWPEVIVAYDSTDKVLFSADAFGTFGSAECVDENWAEEARRYYIGIVGKYGAQVQGLLKKAATLDISKICSLHGPVLTENLGYYIELYNKWSTYTPEDDGVLIAYTSVYGNTKNAVLKLAEILKQRGKQVHIYDLCRCDMTQAVAHAFKYDTAVFATTTYNADIFPPMAEFLSHLTKRNYSNRTVGFIENGSWAPMAVKVMKESLSSCKNLKFAENDVKIMSALNNESEKQLENLANEL